MTAPADFRQRLEVETPEHVVLAYEIAGLGSRALAALIDNLILLVWFFAFLVILGLLAPGLGRATDVIAALTAFVSVWGYFVFFEALRQGQTPGKRRVGIRVVRDTGHAVSFSAAAVRNLLRVVDLLPPPYLLGALFVALHPRGKRIGDIVAGTVVVRDRPTEVAPPLPEPEQSAEAAAGVPELGDEEFRVLREFTERATSLPPEVRTRLAIRLSQRLADRFPNRPADPVQFLVSLYADELARRRGRFGGATAAAERKREPAGGAADRLVTRKSARWDQFQAIATRAARDGLDGFAASELPDFAARYREVAADLARARTYRAEPQVLARLERLVAAGHNALYRDERRTGSRIWRFVARECPAGIIEARRAVLLAFLLFAGPAVGGFLLLRERPGLAEEVLPQVMLERAEAGRARQEQGQGYYVAEEGSRPLMASVIMTNNIGVAFNCFASGVFAGVGSLVLLAYNGLAMGAFSGHFANLDLLGYLWTFILGHGVLELFAIWVSGAAGFLLGRALIAPGDLPRGEALTLAGRLAIRMVGASAVLLVIAGLIEGFVSAGEGPLAYRAAVSGASLLFLVMYLVNGWLFLRSAMPPAVSRQS